MYEATQEQIAEWKAKYGSVAKFTIQDNGEIKAAYVRMPKNSEIDYASANLTRGAILQYGITLFNTCKIAGDEIKSDAALRAISKRMSELIETAEADLEKL